MNPSPKRICYLICVFNDQAGLNRTLASVFADDLLADVLVVDDGSSLACTLPPLPSGLGVTLLRLDQNVGLVVALNKGLEFILKEGYAYIARLDAGDTVNYGRLKAQMEYLDTHPNIGLLGTQMRAFDQSTGRTLFELNNPSLPSQVMRTLKVRNCIAHPSAMMRASVLSAVGHYDPTYRYGEDYEMWRRIIRSYTAANLPTVYVNKAIAPTQLTAIYRRGFLFSKLNAQRQYFEASDPWCWLGIGRTLLALLIPRWLLLRMRTRSAKWSRRDNEPNSVKTQASRRIHWNSAGNAGTLLDGGGLEANVTNEESTAR